MQANREIRECVCCEGRNNTHCTHKRNTREPYYPSKGNPHKHNGKTSKILDGLPISLGQVQHKQIRHKWPKSVAKHDHLYYDRDQEQSTQQKVVGHMKAKFTGIADKMNSEFQGHYSPIDTNQQINSTSGQQVKGEIIEQSIIPIHVMPTPQAQELTGPNEGPHCPIQIFQQEILMIQSCIQNVDLPLQITHLRDLLVTISW